MPDTLTISLDGMLDAERERLMAVVDTCRRNRKIRRRYRELQPRIGKWRAIAELSDEFCRSERQIRRVIYGF